jgi:hypothetical protein
MVMVNTMGIVPTMTTSGFQSESECHRAFRISVNQMASTSLFQSHDSLYLLIIAEFFSRLVPVFRGVEWNRHQSFVSLRVSSDHAFS